MNSIEQLEISGSHREVGQGIGLRFAGAIHRLFDNYDFLQKQLLPFLKTSAGQSFFQSCLKMHQTHFPQYIAELEGMADGSGRPFEEIFAVNLRGEFAGRIALASPNDGTTAADVQGCTDCLVLTPDAALIGHNEDGSPAGHGNMYCGACHRRRLPHFHGPLLSGISCPEMPSALMNSEFCIL